MAFRISTETFSTTFSEDGADTKTGKKRIKKFFSQMQKYLAQSEDPGARLMGEWIAKGEKMCYFTCRGDVLRDMLTKMYKNAVPYVVAMDGIGNNGVVIRGCDQEKTEFLQGELLQEKSREVFRITEAQMKDNILASEFNDKNMLTLYGLSKADASILLENCTELTDDGMLSLTEMNDGTFKLSGPAVVLMERRRKKRIKNIDHALLLSLLSTSGANREKNIKRANSKEKFEDLLACRFKKGKMDLDLTPAWVINKDPLNKEYMKVTEAGFSTGTYQIKDGRPEFTEKAFYPAISNDYSMRLVSACVAFSKPDVSYDIASAMEAARTAARQEPFFIGKDLEIEKVEAQTAQKLDHMIESRMANTGMMSSYVPYSTRSDIYMKDAAAIMLAVAGKGPVPDGYSQRDIQELKSLFEDSGLSSQTYADRLTEKLSQIQVDSKVVEPQRISDIESELRRINPEYRRRPSKEELLANLAKLQNEKEDDR